MRIGERGIGNLPFIAVLVLLVIAVALFFMARAEADDAKQQLSNAKKTNDTQRNVIVAARDAYDAWVEVSGLKDNALVRGSDDTYPTRDTVVETMRTWMMAQVSEIVPKSEVLLANKAYTVEEGKGVTVQDAGEKKKVTLYGTPFAKETVTFVDLLAPLGDQFAYAKTVIEANNTLYETATATYKTRTGELQTENGKIKDTFESDVQAKSQLYDTEKQRADDMSDQVNGLSATNDQLQATISTQTAAHEKEKRTLLREVSAWKNRAIAEKVTKTVALKEDPSDGEVLYADRRTQLVFINRGRNFHVSNGMKFTVWRTGKGGTREDIAVIRVISVEKTSAKCNVVAVKNGRVPITQGMQISNPFYDPFKRLRVYIAGNLRYYPSDIAKRRLAESGADVTDHLDDRVNVIVLGTPQVSMPSGDEGDEEGMAAAKARAAAEREKRLRDIRETAVTLGAIVVTENVLRTFMSY